MTIVANVLRYPIFLDKVIYCDLFDVMARCLGDESHYSNFATKKEAVWAISNAAAFRRPDVNSTLIRLNILPKLIHFMTQSYEMDLQATSRAIETINHILVTGELFKPGGAAHRGRTNPYADEMSESTDSVPTLMTLYCLISGRGLEGLEEGESMVGDMAGKIRKVLVRWFIPKMTRLVDEGQWASPIVAAPLNGAENPLRDQRFPIMLTRVKPSWTVKQVLTSVRRSLKLSEHISLYILCDDILLFPSRTFNDYGISDAMRSIHFELQAGDCDGGRLFRGL
ncbi:hypothetical protein HDV00_005683 [Rhizophlyctis rosea]|nr:hypothetical protein HDV00_005683 [Rhizophlyctis rosea]